MEVTNNLTLNKERMKNYLIKIDELEEIIFKLTTMEIAKDKACELISEICEKRSLTIPVVVTKEELTFSTTGDRSSNVVRYTDPKTGKTQLWLEYSVYKFMEDTPENEKKLLDLHKSLWPSSGWILKLKHLLEFVKKGRVG